MYVFLTAVVRTRNLITVAFYVSQGSVATYIRCGGKRGRLRIASSLLNPAAKEFENRLTT